MNRSDMLPRGQHHLPQFLLKGFASRSRKKQHFTWLFRKDLAPVEANITGIAKIRDFYGAPTDSPLEQRLSAIESGFAPLVRRLRDSKGLEDRRGIAEFVASTQVRTANLRAGLAVATQGFVAEFAHALSDPGNQEILASRVMRGVMEKIASGELKHVLDMLPPADRQEFLANLLPKLAAQIPEWTSDLASYLGQEFSPVKTRQSSGDIQNKVLNESLTPEPRVEQLLELDWRVESFGPHSLILGDIGVLTGTDRNQFTNLMRVEPPLHAVYLPISSECVLVGQRVLHPAPSPEAMNRASAELSREFFVASANQPAFRDLARRLGCDADLLPVSEMRAIVQASLAKLD